ncbi:MAG: hypothetical protein OJF51_001596 [Nitrospira sp.]|nr:MAG: hypothetical protein OJF51_001596 [Nitrospira sp.]
MLPSALCIQESMGMTLSLEMGALSIYPKVDWAFVEIVL